MGFFNALLNLFFKAQDDFYDKSDKYNSGYNDGYNKASKMTDAELKSSIQKSVNNGVSDWKSAGKTRAMVDEYKNRK